MLCESLKSFLLQFISISFDWINQGKFHSQKKNSINYNVAEFTSNLFPKQLIYSDLVDSNEIKISLFISTTFLELC